MSSGLFRAGFPGSLFRSKHGPQESVGAAAVFPGPAAESFHHAGKPTQDHAFPAFLPAADEPGPQLCLKNLFPLLCLKAEPLFRRADAAALYAVPEFLHEFKDRPLHVQFLRPVPELLSQSRRQKAEKTQFFVKGRILKLQRGLRRFSVQDLRDPVDLTVFPVQRVIAGKALRDFRILKEGACHLPRHREPQGLIDLDGIREVLPAAGGHKFPS